MLVYEIGVNRGSFGSYAVGDTFKGGAEGRADSESGESRWSEMRQVREMVAVISAPTSPLYVATQSVAPEVTSTSETMAAIPTATSATSATGDVSPTPTPTSSSSSRSSSRSSTSSKGSYRIDATTDTVVYIHSDHLGSVSTVTNQSGGVVSTQQFDPWGKVRSGGISVTDLNYTGQRKDSTGLLYYHARYYDPSLARFVSPDSIVPGAASGVGGAGGSVGAWQNSSLTVDFHESDFLSSTNKENAFTVQKGFWFQLGRRDRNRVDPSGPENPQALSRYSYVLNNPLRYIDPTGHYVYAGTRKDPTTFVLILSHSDMREIAARAAVVSGTSGGGGAGIETWKNELEKMFPGISRAGRALVALSLLALVLASTMAVMADLGWHVGISCVQGNCSIVIFTNHPKGFVDVFVSTFIGTAVKVTFTNNNPKDEDLQGQQYYYADDPTDPPSCSRGC